MTQDQAKGLCNNYLEAGGGESWKIGEIFPKLSHTPPLIKQKLISTPPHIMIILRLAPSPPLLKKVSSYRFSHA